MKKDEKFALKCRVIKYLIKTNKPDKLDEIIMIPLGVIGELFLEDNALMFDKGYSKFIKNEK